MRAINVFLAILISLLCGVLVLEGGLRLLGRGPTTTINRFDPITGWSKKPGAVGHRKTDEFNVSYKVNELGLRDPDTNSHAKPAGTYRVVFLGDSFTLGYTVDEHDLFVEQLGRAWTDEGRKVDVVNAGTEGWSTDQEVAWFTSEGVKFQPDLVLLFPYENDLYWNGQTQYDRFPKPRYDAQGKLDSGLLVDPGAAPLTKRVAVLRFAEEMLQILGLRPRVLPPSGIMEVPFEKTKFSETGGRVPAEPLTPRTGYMMREQAALMLQPPDFMQDAIARTRGALTLLRDSCASAGAKLVIAPIPSKYAVQARSAQELKDRICLRDEDWHPNQPVKVFLALAHELGIPALDATEKLRAVAMTPERAPGAEGEPDIVPDLYFHAANEFHLNPRGNLEFAHFLRDQLDVSSVGLPSAVAAQTRFEPVPPPSKPAKWPYLFGGLWLALTALYYGNYKDEPKWQPPLKVLAMLSAVFLIFFGLKTGMGLVPARFAQPVVLLFVVFVLGFVLYKLGRRIGTILELSKAFVLRGHWYLMPLLVVLLSIGSLLVVAASSPLVAPFIYTLF